MPLTKTRYCQHHCECVQCSVLMSHVRFFLYCRRQPRSTMSISFCFRTVINASTKLSHAFGLLFWVFSLFRASMRRAASSCARLISCVQQTRTRVCHQISPDVHTHSISDVRHRQQVCIGALNDCIRETNLKCTVVTNCAIAKNMLRKLYSITVLLHSNQTNNASVFLTHRGTQGYYIRPHGP